MFDSEQALVRIDMSEFMEQHSVARLIGAPPGYVGYEEGGYLTEAVRRRPYSLLLLDEVEKAHPDVFNILLQVLEDGRLTDGQGRTVDFRNSVIVMTSNLGSEHIREALDDAEGESDSGAVKAAIQAKVMSDVAMHFRPEFLNRIDESVVFHALGRGHVREIAALQLTALEARLAERDVQLSLDADVTDYLVGQGFDPVYGARPLKRAIQRLIENPLAEALLGGEFTTGDRIVVSRSGEALQFAKASAVSAAA